MSGRQPGSVGRGAAGACAARQRPLRRRGAPARGACDIRGATPRAHLTPPPTVPFRTDAMSRRWRRCGASRPRCSSRAKRQSSCTARPPPTHATARAPPLRAASIAEEALRRLARQCGQWSGPVRTRGHKSSALRAHARCGSRVCTVTNVRRARIMFYSYHGSGLAEQECVQGRARSWHGPGRHAALSTASRRPCGSSTTN